MAVTLIPDVRDHFFDDIQQVSGAYLHGSNVYFAIWRRSADLLTASFEVWKATAVLDALLIWQTADTSAGPGDPHDMYYGSFPDPATTPARVWTGFLSGLTTDLNLGIEGPRATASDCDIIYATRIAADYTVTIIRFDMRTDSYLAELSLRPPFETDPTTYLDDIATFDHTYLCGRTSDGALIAALPRREDVGGDGYARIKIGVWDGSAWADLGDIPGQSTAESYYFCYGLLQGSNGVTHIFYQQLVPDTPPLLTGYDSFLFHVALLADGSFGSTTALGQIINGSFTGTVSTPLRYTDPESGQIRIGIAYFSGGAGGGGGPTAIFLASSLDSPAPSFSVETVYPFVTFTFEAATNAVNGGLAKWTLGVLGGKLTAVWVEGLDAPGPSIQGAVRYAVRSSGIWGSDTTYYEPTPNQTSFGFGNSVLSVSLLENAPCIAPARRRSLPQYRKPLFPGAGR